MPSPQRSLFFLLTILLSLHLFPLTSTLALTLPPPPSPPTITILPTNLTRSPSSSSSPPLNSIFNCVRKSWFAPCPDYFDCARAILELPDYESVGSFHNGPPNDPFRLPLSKTEGTCRVRIELAHEGGSTQGGSWHIVVARSLSLAHICFKEPLRANMGGWTALGNHERLLVILEYSGVRDAVGIGVGVGNVTII